MLIAQPEPSAEIAPRRQDARQAPPGGRRHGWRLLLSPPILLNLGFFILTSIMGGGLNTYLVVALGALHATPPAIANMALTSLLAMNAVGVLAGGILAGRTTHHAAGRGVRPDRRRHRHGAGRACSIFPPSCLIC